ncbi:DUF2612 domain-containing protein [Pseudomonas fluorescens]|uniref:Protein of uncharacterized function (DUF2612) n=2 Tax=Pseudomonas fluorescens TaxID=294 RepID=A0A3M3XDP9_PSEFL|nr:DUF2612 domain-containing protein [Pseudomonas fluorescens]MCI4605394.1 DUF2612 domain-containing protein [Pseudomonas fluorescens]PQB00225.1 hypothetical protein B0A76_14355 [Pseudomonas fluorescens]RFP96715.1 DUF2612 domain-containing protein [Pseudomonas fluorescens]RMO68186.1 hypothetical protein ALQ35_03870 [Pseudomonas fluorescens]TWR48609.1 DUF2612 domain-containing protein [Pseudomonas fluorescens]
MIIDHVERARSRIINEYRNKQRMVDWLTIVPEIANQNLESPLDRIYRSYDVDTVVGEELDIIGRIVGVPRPILRAAAFDVFGYQGNDSYTNYNIAPYIGDGEAVDAPLNNDLYRKLIKAKIARNISDGTADSIIQLVEIIIGVKVTALVSNVDKSFDIGVASTLDNTTLYLIENFDLIPRPQGARIGEIFVLPINIDAIEASSSHIYEYGNVTLPGDLA